jgi:hypothetical protein
LCFDGLERRELLTIGHPGDGFLDLTFIGDGYTAAEMGTFHADVDRARTALLAVEPFRSRSDQIRFHALDNLESLGTVRDSTGVGAGRLLTVDFMRTSALVDASGLTTDFICALIDDPAYGGSGGGITVSYNGSDLPAVLVHEFGHTFGLLSDEYTYGTTGVIDNQVHSLAGVSATGNVYAGAPTAAAWSGLVAADEYFVGGEQNNWYRPSMGSIMRGQSSGPESDTFNAPSQEALRTQLDYWASPSDDHLAPQVTIVGLNSGDTVSGVVPVATNLVDDRAVMRTQLWVNGVLARNATKAPFTLDWTTGDRTTGTYSLEVRAYDASGNMGVSPTVTVNLVSPASLELLSPANGEPVSTSVFPVTVDLWTGGIDRVELEVDGRRLPVSWTPYLQGLSFSIWPSAYGLTLTPGSHTLTAIGYRTGLDPSSLVEQARASSLFSVAGVVQPAIAIQSPPPGAVVSKQVALGIDLLAGGTPTKVTYSIDGKPVGTATVSPFPWIWDSRKTKDGTHVLRAVATYATGQSVAASSSFVVRNTVDRQAPTLSLTSPRNNARLRSGQLVIAGKAKDNVGLRAVELYLDNQLVASSSASPFRWTTDVATLALGRHRVRARAIDLSGNARWSPILVVTRV